MSNNPVRLPPSHETLDTLEKLKCMSPSRYFERLEREAAGLGLIRDQLEKLVQRRAEETALKADELAGRKAALEDELEMLAATGEVEYELHRKETAKRLGMRLSALDKAVKTKRKAIGSNVSCRKQWEPRVAEPCSYQVNGADVLGEVAKAASRYLHLPRNGATILALWTAHTYCFDAQPHTPRLAITSATKGCGKTSVRDFLSLVCQSPLTSENVTPAAVFRLVEKYQPTLLLDELDNRFSESNELRRILNSGWQRGGMVHRVEDIAGERQVVSYATHAPATLGAIGRLPSTLEDRSIELRMEPALPGELRARLRTDRPEKFEDLRSRLARFTENARETITEADPEMPGAYNRVADRWRILIAIADAAGGEWPVRARAALETEIAATQASNDGDAAVLLLHDLRTIFDQDGKRLASMEIVERLVALEEHPWAEWRRGRPFTQPGLAKLLGRFGIRPKQLKLEGRNVRGYQKEQFEGVFKRFLEGSQCATPLPSVETLAFTGNETATFDNIVALANGRKDAESLQGSEVAVCTPGAGIDDLDERAAILEFDAGLPREEAEFRAREEIIGNNRSNHVLESKTGKQP